MSDDRIKQGLVKDHAELYDPEVVRRYFETFARITGHMERVARELEAEGRFGAGELAILGQYVGAIAATFTALGQKYVLSGKEDGAPRLTIDRHESGFPVAQELMTMAVDAAQADKHLAGMPAEAEIKDRMIRAIVGELEVPRKLQFALAQRYYFEALGKGGMFWTRNDPQAVWVEAPGPRRHYLVHWAVWDSQNNLPILYLMDLEDSGRHPLPKDADRWPAAQAALLAQSIGGLKLLTIATGFDQDFDTLHPKRLRRVYLGPMYSAGYTLQSGPISKVLEDAKAPDADDWALVWTLEDLVSDREDTVDKGWFSAVAKQVYKLDPVSGADTGTTSFERMIVLPERPYQVLVEQNPAGLRAFRKFVVGAGGKLIPAR